MRARDQSSIFSTGGKFCPGYGLLLELHTLTLVARSYALLHVHNRLVPRPPSEKSEMDLVTLAQIPVLCDLEDRS